jgi:cell wall-associated NlpC family hydrolase
VAAPAARLSRPLAASVVAFLATVAVVFGAQTVVFATPTPGQIEAQIDEKFNQVEPIIEKYNALHAQLASNQAQVDKLTQQIAPLKMRVDLAMTRIGALSAELYELGPSAKFSAVLDASDPSAFIEQLSTLNAIATTQTESVADAIALKRQYDQQKQPLDAKVAELKAQTDALDAQKKDIEKQITDLQKLRLAAYGTGGGTGNLRPVTCPQVYDGSPGAKAAQFACKQIGKPYVWGADGPGSYDCSGLTSQAWASVGIYLPHNAYQQKQVTTRISKADLKVGDLIFMYSDVHHVVIYVGNGWDVAAPTYGEPVQMQKPFDTPGRINSYGRPHS